MSNRTVSVTLTAKDGISKTFKSVGDAGKRMGDELQRSAERAEREIEELGRTSEKTGRSLDSMTGDARNLGLGIGVMVGGLALAGKSFRDNEVELSTLRRTYGAAADDLIEYANALQDTTNFSNDAAVAATNTFGTLARNYDFTAEQIKQLLAVTADLAAANGVELSYAAQAVAAAMRGEAEMAEQLGLTLNNAAIGLDNVTAAQDQAAAGSIRFNALLDQSAYAVGAAAEQSDTLYGAMTDIENKVNDAGQALAGFSPELAGVGAYAAENAIQLGVMGLAIGQVAKGASSAKNLIGAAGLAGSLGPAGLAFAAGTLAVGGLAALWLSMDEGESRLDRTRDALEDVNELVLELDTSSRLAGANLVTALGLSDLSKEAEGLAALEERLTTIIGLVPASGTSAASIEGMFTAAEKAMLGWEEIAADGTITADEWAAAIEGVGDAAAGIDPKMQAIIGSMDDITAIMFSTTEAGKTAQLTLAGLFSNLDSGQITPEQFEAGVAGAADGLVDLALQSALTTEAINEQAEAWNRLGTVLGIQAEEQRFAGAERAAVMADMHRENENFGYTMDMIHRKLYDNVEAMDVASGATRSYATETAQLGQALEASWANFNTDMVAADFEAITLAVTGTTQALDNTFRVVVSNTNALGSSSQAVADWATELIAAEGTYSALDDLLANGRINIIEYNMAQEAHNDIQRENAEIQEHIQAIQAKQAPLIADMIEQQENYLQTVADMPATQQLVALALMDTTTNAKAMEIAMLAASGAGADAMLPIIEGAIAANPPLQAVLEKMGLISVGTDGTITMNTEGATQPMAELTAALDTLTVTLWSIFVDGDPSGAIAAVDDAEARLRGIDGNTGTVYIVADASGFETVWTTINGRTGSASVYVDAYGPGISFEKSAGFQHGGLIEAAQHGRMMGGVTLVGENGPELLLGGNHVVPHTASMNAGRSGGTSVVIERIDVNGDIYDTGDLAVALSREIVPGIERAFKQHERGYS